MTGEEEPHGFQVRGAIHSQAHCAIAQPPPRLGLFTESKKLGTTYSNRFPCQSPNTKCLQKLFGEVLFTLVMRWVPWNVALQCSQKMLQSTYLCLSYVPYHTGTQSLRTAQLSQETKDWSSDLPYSNVPYSHKYTAWVSTENLLGVWFLYKVF